MAVKILIALKNKITREGLIQLLNNRTGAPYKVVGEADNGQDVVALAKSVNPDVVLIGVHLPKLNGIEATQRICKNRKIKVVVLSQCTNHKYVDQMLKAGAKAYVLKSCGIDEIERAINAVTINQDYLCPQVTSVVIDVVSAKKTSNDNYGGNSCLTRREREVLQLLAEGVRTKNIARNLGVSIKTVESHRRHMMHKLRIFTVAGLTKYAISAGITSLDMM